MIQNTKRISDNKIQATIHIDIVTDDGILIDRVPYKMRFRKLSQLEMRNSWTLKIIASKITDATFHVSNYGGVYSYIHNKSFMSRLSGKYGTKLKHMGIEYSEGMAVITEGEHDMILISVPNRIIFYWSTQRCRQFKIKSILVE
jgi:hypothetical protein